MNYLLRALTFIVAFQGVPIWADESPVDTVESSVEIVEKKSSKKTNKGAGHRPKSAQSSASYDASRGSSWSGRSFWIGAVVGGILMAVAAVVAFFSFLASFFPRMPF